VQITVSVVLFQRVKKKNFGQGDYLKGLDECWDDDDDDYDGSREFFAGMECTVTTTNVQRCFLYPTEECAFNKKSLHILFAVQYLASSHVWLQGSIFSLYSGIPCNIQQQDRCEEGKNEKKNVWGKILCQHAFLNCTRCCPSMVVVDDDHFILAIFVLRFFRIYLEEAIFLYICYFISFHSL